ncbi:MAG: cobyrinate a,c-diamide synthase [Chloroflexi bacterium]|nr:cobyrinate a,c-diamide synthase [Chloroflexota bacterium]
MCITCRCSSFPAGGCRVKIETPRLVIAAPASGSGKSTIATGLMAALSRDHAVQGFKVGPDYIDPGYHTAATGRVSRNLDTWMVPIPAVQATFARATADTDIAIIEGVMGLFDGYETKTESGSTAEVAKLLSAPVILVLDVGKMARSAGALALGYRDFDPALNVAAVICNNVGSDKHALWVTEAVESIGLPVLGCIPRTPELRIPERHLGLHTAVERTAEVQAFLSHAAELVTQHIDLDRLWQIARAVPSLAIDLREIESEAGPVVQLGVARDEAFCFYYEDNFDLLRLAGAEVVFFSPLHDDRLPEGIAGLYLGGGYPELYAAQLAGNTPMLSAIRAAIQAGMPVYAECGGLMALTQSITDLSGTTYPMIGVLPGQSHMRERLTMGYRNITADRDTLLLPQGEQTRGHEFHYSDWVGAMDNIPRAYRITPRLREDVRFEGYAHGNLLASYVHLHFGAHPALATNCVRACQAWQAEQERT